MDLVCHRCNATVDPDANYCLQCGAPQVRFVAQAEEATVTGVEGAAIRQPDAEVPGSIHWKLTTRIAALAALVAGILSTLLAAGSVLWVAVGAIFVIGAYRRRQPHAILPPRSGARIGALMGLMAAAVALAGNAIFLVIQRYGMHQGKLIDTQLTAIVKQAAERATTMDSGAPITAFTSYWLSAEGRIGLILLTMAFLSLLILLFAIAGGAIGAQIYRSRRERKAIL
jgi:ribosomal protein L40E